MGLQIINFTPGTCSNQDYTTPDMGEIYRSSDWLYKKMLSYEKQHTLNGHFLMVHFGTFSARTDKFYHRLPSIIKTLRKRGYEFVTVEQMLGLGMH